jgi:hypothetical protein
MAWLDKSGGRFVFSFTFNSISVKRVKNKAIALILLLITIIVFVSAPLSDAGQEMFTADYSDNDIIGYFHICQKEGWKRSFDLGYTSLKESGMYAASKQIRIGVISDDGYVEEDSRLNDPKFQIVYVGRSSEYERPTLLHMRKMSELDNNGTLYYYLHSKGIRHFGTEKEPVILKWLDQMFEGNFVKWREAVEILQTYETYGIHMINHYQGNFWWATRDHIKKLSKTIQDYYTAPEDWVLTNNDHAYCAWSCPGKGTYECPYPDGFYRH